ncbi:MAG TPA: hypothetical protein VLT90_16595 [Terriglobales bacterium]|nr:hypothetical protein [Terriglobales bacterium]
MGRLTAIFLLLFASCSSLLAQSTNRTVPTAPAVYAFAADGTPNPPLPSANPPSLAPAVSLPRMSPELALSTYQQRSNRQAQTLAGYSADTLIRADLPDNAQHGEYELQRHYTAPHTLSFKSVRFEGDGFVKTNVIARLLQSEVDHALKDDPAATALRPENYKFSYKGVVQDGDQSLHVYQVKPRQKRVGLFKGYIFLDATTGSLIRAQGRVAKSPSLFVKKIDFMQEYAEIQGFTLPIRMHSEAKVALVGRAIVDITNHDYQPIAAPTESAAASGSH